MIILGRYKKKYNNYKVKMIRCAEFTSLEALEETCDNCSNKCSFRGEIMTIKGDAYSYGNFTEKILVDDELEVVNSKFEQHRNRLNDNIG